MKISELRIGNLVKIKTSNDAAFYPVYAIDGMGLKVVLGGCRQCEGWKTEELLKPIALTEEILQQCGFVKKENGISWDTFTLKKIELQCAPTPKGKTYVYNVNGSYMPILSLHQLQNLYFSLSGEELEVII